MRKREPKLIDVARAALHGRNKNITIFLGLSDEGLACEGGSFIRPGDQSIVEKMEQFNQTQDYDILKKIVS